MIFRRFPFLLVAIVFVLPICLPAQKLLTRGQLWMGYYLTADFSKKIFLFTELENRQFIDPDAQNFFFIRTHLHFKLGEHWDVAPGFSYWLLSTQDPLKPNKSWTPEYRPFEEVNNNYTFGKRFLFYNRFRIEQRFIQKTVDGRLAEGFNFNWRFRFRTALDILLFETEKKTHRCKLRISDEVMVNAGKIVTNIFDQNRAYVGFNYQPPGPMSFELGYMHFFQARIKGEEYFNRHIARISVFHKIQWKNGNN